MYITGKNRYDAYTSRYDVYLFTLRDWVEVLLDKFNGKYIERSDMSIHAGYLLKFVDYDAAKAFIESISTSRSTDKLVTTYVLPHLEGNEFPVYATTAVGTNVVYIGLSEYPEVLNEFIGEQIVISFNANGGTGSISSIYTLAGNDVTIPDSTGLTAPASKKFSSWNTKDDGTGDEFDANSIEKFDEDTILYAIWIDE